jgi:transposase InsO family protein
MCAVLEVSTSGYYAWCGRAPSARSQQDVQLLAEIRDIHQASRGTYGAPRVQAELRLGRGIRCSRKRVARLLRQAGLSGVHRRRRGCTQRNPQPPPPPDLVQRDFVVLAPNRLWVADLTQHGTGEGWLYLATVLDAFSRRVVGWAMGPRAQTELVVAALDMAIWNRRPEPGVVDHSDHGSQYTAVAFTQRLQQAGLAASMGSVGDALDNALAESVFASLQTELLDRGRWATRQSLATAIFSYIEGFYNRTRRHPALGYLSPEEFEQEARRAWRNTAPDKLSATACSG